MQTNLSLAWRAITGFLTSVKQMDKSILWSFFIGRFFQSQNIQPNIVIAESTEALEKLNLELLFRVKSHRRDNGQGTR